MEVADRYNLINMTVAEWLACALTDVERRYLPEMRPVLEGLARMSVGLRAAAWNADASDRDDTRTDEAHGRS